MAVQSIASKFRLAILVSLQFALMGSMAAGQLSAQGTTSLEKSIAAIRQVGREGAGFDEAISGAAELRRRPIGDLTAILDGMAEASPVAENWLRGVVFDIARKADKVPVETLRDYAMDQSNNPIGRGLAMELIQKNSPELATKLIAQCLHDPSLPLREMAVQQAIQGARKIEQSDAEAAKARYREVLVAARHPRQLSNVVEALGKLGEEVKTADAFAMITQWKSLAPLDNVDGVGFDAKYQPEVEFGAKASVDLEASYEGKAGSIRWQPVASSGDEGVVDLAAAYNKEKGAVCYLYTEFEAAQSQPAEVRLGCINANKVWINGQLVMANEVYHAGSMIDQYIAGFKLKQGTNRILLKICQNEQSEPWAQDWQFQFRITDPTGKGLRSGD
ncbi:MAG: hypothetical protein MI861_03010 [Pirellulales bacterium]|nr:hypothetical protein [Pirellulales bacterium]